LLGLLNDILDFSKIEAGQLIIEKSNFSLPEMLDTITAIFMTTVEEKGLELHIDQSSADIPVYVKGDELRLRQILVNLISNGIKFTEQGSILVQINPDNKDDGKIELHFSVKDTGIGIPLKKQAKVFSSFSQADDSTSRKFGGTGLGLSICKQLVEMMGGQIWLESREGEGSTFHFSVTLESGVKEHMPPRRTISEEPVFLQKLNVLLVDDNKINCDLARVVLEQQNHVVIEAHTGIEALEQVIQRTFDLILMDVQMPVMDGLVTTAIIRESEKGHISHNIETLAMAEKLTRKLAGSHIPIIAMTANAMGGDRQKCLDVGMDEYLTKPFMPEHLHNVLQLLFQDIDIEQAEILEERGCENVQENPTMEHLTKQVRHHLKTVYGIDDAVARQMVGEAASSLVEALDAMTDALKINEWSVVRKSAHSLKGVLLNMGIEHLADQAKAIEKEASKGFVVQDAMIDGFTTRMRAFIIEMQSET